MKSTLQISLLILGIFLLPASAQQEAKKIAEVEVGEVSCDNTKGYLDYLYGELYKNPTAKAYIIFYGARSYPNSIYMGRGVYKTRRLLPKRGEAEARVSYWKPYLINAREVEASRIEVICGGYRERPIVELWVVPAGSHPPQASPTLSANQIKFRQGKPKNRDMFGESDCWMIPEGGITTACSSTAR
jgi:hypothetical protein